MNDPLKSHAGFFMFCCFEWMEGFLFLAQLGQNALNLKTISSVLLYFFHSSNRYPLGHTATILSLGFLVKSLVTRDDLVLDGENQNINFKKEEVKCRYGTCK